MAEKRLLDKAEWALCRSSSHILLGAWEQEGCRSWEKYRVSDIPNEHLTLADIEGIPVDAKLPARSPFITPAMLEAGMEALFSPEVKDANSFESTTRRVYHAMEAVRSAEEFASAKRRSATDEA